MNNAYPPHRHLRWWPAVLVLVLAALVIAWTRGQTDWPFQRRNLQTVGVILVTGVLLLLWWVVLSRAPWRLRLAGAAGFLGIIGLVAGMFRISGVSGDLIPILEPRWARHVVPVAAGQTNAGVGPASVAQPASAQFIFPQFLGPDRTATLAGFALDPDWGTKKPVVLWRQPVGAAWSGFVILGERVLTQEQRGEEECVTCYETLTGRPVWSHADPAHYHTTLAGEGPRCTPTVVGDRVFALGATGILSCLDLATGRKIWSRNIGSDAKRGVPEWGYSGSPLVIDETVVVSAGGSPDLSLIGYRSDTGEIAWSGGSAPVNYGSPFLTTLAGVRQILVFNSRNINAHHPASGRVLWEYPWGVGQPQVAVPVIVSTNRVLFSSGYGVGSELLEITPEADGRLAATRVWQSRKMKSKFANLVRRDGFLYGLDDGILACVDLKDGTQRWKEGRYGHGQGLLVGDLFLLMSEGGELVLLRPSPEAPNELDRFRVFDSKTWNPIALAGDVLLVRNDREAACLKVALRKGRRQNAE